MRDPARIDRMLALVREIWQRSPDLRLGQLFAAARNYTPLDNAAVTFHVEDDIIEDGLRTWAGEMQKEHA